ncbi:MAG: valine--tRNA ligase [bacterium]
MELSKVYSHKGIEKKWYDFWEKEGFFKADPKSEKPGFSIVLPPPNVTGSLHLGHTVMIVIQDIASRYKRMTGYDVLWLPGTDHAGIATQMVVERDLMKKGLSRHDIGREKFLEKVWEWKKKNGDHITKQLRMLGASLDWSRERFTMDEGLSGAVKEVFIRLYEEDLIYRDNFIINWCPRCHTALSDLEVEYSDTEGALYYVKYPVQGEKTFLEIATTRPETMLGDTAVAVHPDDERFCCLISKKAELPLMNRSIPIIGDAELVDTEFGTGAVKVTPAHDFNDFETGRRHNLNEINVIDEDGKINSNGGKFEGLTVFDARKAVVEALREQKLFIRKEKHSHSVGHCDRCKTVVEPILSRQWFVKTAPLAKPAIDAVKTDKIKFHPSHWKKTYFEWMNNIRDWCISRQLWWGHQIPAWYCDDCGKIVVAKKEPETCPDCGGDTLSQDKDVLDTWFSSALWPFSTMGWPEETELLKKHYPTSLMETGFDILFFWVARMIMMGMKFMDDIPFETVFFHGLIRDEKGYKMSKTKGNVIDPIELIEKYGSDALRFTFAMTPLTATDVKMGEDRVETYRGFINKVYNAFRFAMMQFGKEEIVETDMSSAHFEEMNAADRWITTSLAVSVKNISRNLEDMRYHEAAREIYQFFWHKFCDWYIEMAKVVLYGEDEKQKDCTKKVLVKVLDSSLKLLHPFVPHVTEELWQHLPVSDENRAESIMISEFPESDDFKIFEDAELMDKITDLISEIRTIRSVNDIPPSKEIDIVLSIENDFARRYTEKNQRYIKKLARVDHIKYDCSFKPGKRTATAVITGFAILHISLSGLVDFEKEIAGIQKKLKQTEKDLSRSQAKLKNENFINKAPEYAVKKEKKKFEEFSEKISHLKKRLEKLS